jgi:hypothetical protein
MPPHQRLTPLDGTLPRYQITPPDFREITNPATQLAQRIANPRQLRLAHLLREQTDLDYCLVLIKSY